MRGMRTKRALAFVMALLLSFSTFASDFTTITAFATETSIVQELPKEEDTLEEVVAGEIVDEANADITGEADIAKSDEEALGEETLAGVDSADDLEQIAVDGKDVEKESVEEPLLRSAMALLAKPGPTNSEKVNVTFDLNGGSFVNPAFKGFNQVGVKKNESINLPENSGDGEFVRDGYDFVGWSNSNGNNGNRFNPGDAYKVTKNVTFYAKWEQQTYTIKYNLNGGAYSYGTNAKQIGPQTCKVNKEEQLLDHKVQSLFSRSGYTFTGWNTVADGSGTHYDDRAKVKDLAPANGEITLYAEWKPIDYTITYNKYDDYIWGTASGSVDSQKAKNNESISLSTKSFSCDKGYVQVGWEGPAYMEYYDFGEEYTVTRNVQMDAHWVQSGDYYIVYHLSAKTNVASDSMYCVRDTFYSKQTVLNTYKDVSDFLYWSIPGKEFTCWKDANGVECKPGDTIDLASLYKKAEYKYYGYMSGHYVIDLYGQWEDAAPKTYTITYDANDAEGSVSPVTCDMDATVSLSDGTGLSKTGYDFAGWKYDETIYEAGQSVNAFNEDVTLIAQWEPKTYTIKYQGNGATGVAGTDFTETATVKYGEEITLLTNKEVNNFYMNGYEIVGWSYYNITETEETKNVGEKVTLPLPADNSEAFNLYAVWAPVEYTIKFVVEGVEQTELQQTYTISDNDQIFEVTDPVKSQYRFLGWTTGENKAPSDAVVKAGTFENVVFTAVFEEKKLTAAISGINKYWLEKDYSIAEPEVKDESTGKTVKAKYTYFDENGNEVENSFGLGYRTIRVYVTADDYMPYTQEVTVDVHYYVLGENEKTVAKFTGAKKATVSDKDWYGSFEKENLVTISFDGYKVSKTNDDEYGFKESVDISAAAEERHDYEVYLLKLDETDTELGIVGNDKYTSKYEAEGTYYVDKTAPSTDVKIEQSSVKELLNRVTFGKFYKDTKTAFVSTEDTYSGVNEIYYATFEGSIEDIKAIDANKLEWKVYDADGVKLDANFRGIVCAKAVDCVGNEAIVYTDGLVVYKAIGEADIKEVTYVKTTKSNVEISGTSNGNTINSVIITDNNKKGYSVERDTKETNEGKYAFELKGESLESLPAGDYTVTIVFNCVDIDGSLYNQTQDVKLTVKKANTAIDLSANDWVFDQYSQNITSAVVKNTSNQDAVVNGKVNYFYMKRGSNRETEIKNFSSFNFNSLVPGQYTLKAVYEGDGTYAKSEASVEFKVITPEVYIFLQTGTNSWKQLEKIDAGKLNEELFDVAFKNGNAEQNTNPSDVAKRYFADISEEIVALEEEGFKPSINKISIFAGDNDHKGSKKHFHVDISITKLETNDVGVSIDDWTYGEEANKYLLSDQASNKRGGEQKVLSVYYEGNERGTNKYYLGDKAPVNAGEYKVYVTFGETDYYKSKTVSDSFTVNPKKVTVDWKLDGKAENSVVYDGNSHHVFGEVTNEAYNNETFYVNPIWIENDKTDADTYTSKAWEVVDFFGNRTYNYTFADAEAFTWTIEQKEVTMHWPSNASFTYNGYEQGYYLPGYENVMFGLDWIGLDGIVKSDEYKVYPVLKGSLLRNTNAGTYHVEATGEILGERGGNYKLGGFGSHEEWVQTGFFPWIGYKKNVKDAPHFDWTIDQLVAELSWTGSDTARHTNSDFKFTYSELPYTVTAEVTNIQAKDTVKVVNYLNNVNTYVGKYTTVATKLSNPNYKLPENASQNYSIDWLKADDAAFTEKANEFGWYNTSVTLKKDEFKIREVVGKYFNTVRVSEWASDIKKSNETAGSTIEYQLKNKEGYITNFKYASYKIDETLPTGDVVIGFSSILNNKVFQWFFKNSVFVGVEAQDISSWVGANSGIDWDNVTYQLLNEDGTYTEATKYNKYFGIKIPANQKTDVIVTIADKAGNVKTLATSDDIIVYTDSEAVTTNVNYTKTTNESKEVEVKLNGNTIKAVRNLTTGYDLSDNDYEISGNDIIVLSGEYLDSLAAKENSSENKDPEVYEFAVSYNPLGEDFEFDPSKTYYNWWTRSFENPSPSRGFDASNTEFTVSVSKHDDAVTVNALDKTYDGVAVAATFSTESGRNAVSDNDKFVVEYRANVADQAEDAGWTMTAPANAGSYQVKVTALEDENYYEASKIIDFTIARRSVEVEANDASKVEGSADPTLTYSTSNDVAERVRGNIWRFAGEAPGEYDIVVSIDHSAYPNYDISTSNGTFTITALPVVAVAPPTAPTFTAVAPTEVAEAEEVEAPVEEAVEEMEVPEEETPLAEGPAEVEIEEEAVPEAAATCIMHWVILGVAALYAVYALLRAVQNKKELDGEEKTAEN